MTQTATIAFIGESADAPAELRGFINFRAGMEHRELKGPEAVAVLRRERAVKRDKKIEDFLRRAVDAVPAASAASAALAVPGPGQAAETIRGIRSSSGRIAASSAVSPGPFRAPDRSKNSR